MLKYTNSLLLASFFVNGVEWLIYIVLFSHCLNAFFPHLCKQVGIKMTERTIYNWSHKPYNRDGKLSVSTGGNFNRKKGAFERKSPRGFSRDNPASV